MPYIPEIVVATYTTTWEKMISIDETFNPLVCIPVYSLLRLCKRSQHDGSRIRRNVKSSRSFQCVCSFPYHARGHTVFLLNCEISACFPSAYGRQLQIEPAGLSSTSPHVEENGYH
mmetsp:Transcript_15540/g.43066  ORF Transcript_15540/g.43066 Transcript_15540/m.43066 type:complete len:116 (+) Transcript_15540:2468-2815(+)